MTDTSTINELQAAGFEAEVAAAIVRVIDETVAKAVRKELRSPPTVDLSRFADAESRSFSLANKANWKPIGTAIASVGVILGFLYWQNSLLRDYMIAEIGSVRTEVGSLNMRVENLQDNMRAEFQNVRSDMRPKISGVREEVGALQGQISVLGERTARLEALILEGLPTAPFCIPTLL